MKGLEELKQIASKLTGSYIILKCSCSCPLNAELIAFFTCAGTAEELYQRETQERVSLKGKELDHISKEQKSTSQVYDNNIDYNIYRYTSLSFSFFLCLSLSLSLSLSFSVSLSLCLSFCLSLYLRVSMLLYRKHWAVEMQVH